MDKTHIPLFKVFMSPYAPEKVKKVLVIFLSLGKAVYFIDNFNVAGEVFQWLSFMA